MEDRYSKMEHVLGNTSIKIYRLPLHIPNIPFRRMNIFQIGGYYYMLRVLSENVKEKKNITNGFP